MEEFPGEQDSTDGEAAIAPTDPPGATPPSPQISRGDAEAAPEQDSTPIAMPGKSALLAAVQPAASKALYFVARGDGGSEFSTSLEAHNRAVNKYQRGASIP